MNCTLRTANPADVEAIFRIDRAVACRPWSRRRLLELCESPAPPLVLQREDGVVVAFALYALVLDELSLHNIAVHPDCQRQGLGRQLLRAVLQRGRDAGASRCLLEVRAGNRGARALYLAEGFVWDGVRRGYYQDSHGREDAVLMSRLL